MLEAINSRSFLGVNAGSCSNIFSKDQDGGAE